MVMEISGAGCGVMRADVVVGADGEALKALSVRCLRLGHFENPVGRAGKDAFVCLECFG